MRTGLPQKLRGRQVLFNTKNIIWTTEKCPKGRGCLPLVIQEKLWEENNSDNELFSVKARDKKEAVYCDKLTTLVWVDLE